MAFWQDPGLEPKRSYRFELVVPGNSKDGGIQKFLIEKVSKPGFSLGESEVKYLNHSFFYPGRVTWDEVSFTVIDCLDPPEGNATVSVMKMLETAGYSLPEGTGMNTVSKASSQAALGLVRIHQYRANGDLGPAETWTLNNAWIKAVKFGELDYGSEDMQKVDITLKYDNAFIKVGGTPYPKNGKG